MDIYECTSVIEYCKCKYIATNNYIVEVRGMFKLGCNQPSCGAPVEAYRRESERCEVSLRSSEEQWMYGQYPLTTSFQPELKDK